SSTPVKDETLLEVGKRSSNTTPRRRCLGRSLAFFVHPAFDSMQSWSWAWLEPAASCSATWSSGMILCLGRSSPVFDSDSSPCTLDGSGRKSRLAYDNH